MKSGNPSQVEGDPRANPRAAPASPHPTKAAASRSFFTKGIPINGRIKIPGKYLTAAANPTRAPAWKARGASGPSRKAAKRAIVQNVKRTARASTVP
jgi:hypothetical protein